MFAGPKCLETKMFGGSKMFGGANCLEASKFSGPECLGGRAHRLSSVNVPSASNQLSARC